jgi:hypothetical protein
LAKAQSPQPALPLSLQHQQRVLTSAKGIEIFASFAQDAKDYQLKYCGIPRRARNDKDNLRARATHGISAGGESRSFIFYFFV